MGRVDAPLAVVRPSQNPDLRLSRIRLFAKRIVHMYQLYTLTYIRGLIYHIQKFYPVVAFLLTPPI